MRWHEDCEHIHWPSKPRLVSNGTAGHAVQNNMSLFAALCCAGQRGWELPGRAMWRLGVWPGGGPDVATLSEVPEEFRSQCGLAVGFYASQLFGA